MTVSPNLKVGKDWRGTLNLAFSTLRRIVFLTPDDFSWGDFDPQINWNGMTATGTIVYRARYLKIFKFVWLSIDIRTTLSGAMTSSIAVTVPFTFGGGIAENQQSHFVRIANNANESGMAIGVIDSDQLSFFKVPVVNFVATSLILTLQGVFEAK
jgi:hypothetical protein